MNKENETNNALRRKVQSRIIINKSLADRSSAALVQSVHHLNYLCNYLMRNILFLFSHDTTKAPH